MKTDTAYPKDEQKRKRRRSQISPGIVRVPSLPTKCSLGRNGSGKSAILTAVVLALGGATKVTNRGSSMKDLVQYHKNVATVEVHLNNHGINSYKPEEYGDTIIIQKRISNSSGQYLIKSATGEVVSNKKIEVTNIVDWFNIQIDNPVSVLNQDSSRNFLKSSNPKDLFKFFMLSTQLQQLEDVYVECNYFIKKITKLVNDRSETLPLLKKDMEEAKQKYEMISTYGEKKKKLEELKLESAWAEIIAMERNLENFKNKEGRFCQGLEKLSKEIEVLEEKITDEEKTLRVYESDIDVEGNKLLKQISVIEELDKAKQQFNRKNKILIEQKKSWEKECNRMSNEKQTLEIAISADDKRDEYKQLKENNEECIINTNLHITSLKEEVETISTHTCNIGNSIQIVKQDLQQLNLEEKQFQSLCNDDQRELKQLKGNKDPHILYGQWVKPVLEAIQQSWQSRTFKEKPVGPLGVYIKVKDPKWAHIAEKVIGGHLKSFVVSCSQDSKVLMDILKRCVRNEKRPNIIISKFREQIHNVARFETRSNYYCSLWSILDVSNTVVANTLLDQIQVESILLVPTSDEAAQLLMNRQTVPPNCRSAYTLNGDQYYPDPNFRVYSGSGITRANFLQVSVEERVKNLVKNIEYHKTDLEKVNCLQRAKKQELYSLMQQNSVYQDKQKQLYGKIDNLRKELVKLESTDIPEPPDMSQLLEALNEINDNLKLSKEELQVTVEEYSEVLKEYQGSEENIIKEMNTKHALEDEINILKSNMSNITESLKYYLEEVERVKAKIIYLETKRKKFYDEINEKQQKIDEKISNAEKFSERIESKKNVKEIYRQIIALSEVLKNQEEKQGDLLEAAANFRDRKMHYLQVEAEIKIHRQIMTKFNETMKIRVCKFQTMVKMDEIYLKNDFKKYLTYRNIVGDMNINFNEKKLSIKLQKEIFTETSNEKRPLQDLAMMSGGERSFATVCFILSLWERIDVPFRILDEFDVFMDCVARRQSMELMIKNAKTFNQYIFLTPLDIDISAKNVHTFQMPDPKRN